MITDYVKGLQYLREAHSILTVHSANMLSRSEWNMAAHITYDAMEKVVKAIELLAGLPLTRQHDVKLHQEVLERLPLVGWRDQ